MEDKNEENKEKKKTKTYSVHCPAYAASSPIRVFLCYIKCIYNI